MDRFFVNKLIAAFAVDIVLGHGKAGEQAMLFPTHKTAKRCADFIYIKDDSTTRSYPRIIDFCLDQTKATTPTLVKIAPTISAVIYPKEKWPLAKQYWQHAGDGVSSRRAEFCHELFNEGLLVEERTLNDTTNSNVARLHKGPKRYQKAASIDLGPGVVPTTKPQTPQNVYPEVKEEVKESSQFVEERFGRNLNMSLVQNAQTAIKRRIAGSLVGDMELSSTIVSTSKLEMSTRGVPNLSEDDVYLYPCGMNAIFNAHQLLLEARGEAKSISFGFPYVDTLKILEKWGPGCLFYGNGSSEDIDNLEARLERGERYLALFCEFPGNPLLKSPDLKRLHALSKRYDFAIVVDETIGNFINIHVLPFADIIVSSLTKIFTGECNVSGGSSILNPQGQYYSTLKDVMKSSYENNYWAEDIIFMERNSRDFISRIVRINRSSEIITNLLASHPAVKQVYYPGFAPAKTNYDSCRTPNGGYGGLFSVTFKKHEQAVAFFDAIDTAKGPSLGTNFTLTSPYAILAHYGELEWAREFGVEADLVRVSVGLEEEGMLREIFESALKEVEKL